MNDDTICPRDSAADAAEIARLAALDPLEYDREREAAAKRLGARVGTLDDMVKAARPMPEAADGRGVLLPEAEPWPEPVDGAALLAELVTAIRRHVILAPPVATCIALWVTHSWVYARFQHTPRLAIRSPVKRCGKSTLLDVLRATCHRPLKADNITASGVFRTVEALRPLTLLIDEADTFMEGNEELRGILNSGFEQSGEVIRVVEVKDEWQPVRFATFAPVALAGIGDLPGTLEDRAVPVVLERKAAAESVAKLRSPGARAQLHNLARKLARWALDRGASLPTDPPIPEALGDREGDIAVPLLSIADDAGGEWPARARQALLTTFGVRAAAEGAMETGVLLLRDIKVLFLGSSSVRMPSAEIVKHLGEMEERPWSEWRHGKPMTAPQLARALAPFRVRPVTIRTGAETAKGYYREAFEEAWERYLPPETPPAPVAPGPEPSQRNIVDGATGFAEPRSVTAEGALRVENREDRLRHNDCDGVTAPRGEGAGDEVFDEVDAWISG